MNLPIQVTEIEVNKDWRPEVGKQYIIEYQWTNKKESWWLIGTFSPVWFGFTFHWPWSAANLQLSTEPYSNDWESFKRVYEFEPHPEPDFIDKKDVEICDCKRTVCGICSQEYCDHVECKCVKWNMR